MGDGEAFLSADESPRPRYGSQVLQGEPEGDLSVESLAANLRETRSPGRHDYMVAMLDQLEGAAEHARQRGIILADTKFEFGLDDAGELTLGDEVCTPDSSRFWPADEYEPGRAQASFD